MILNMLYVFHKVAVDKGANNESIDYHLYL